MDRLLYESRNITNGHMSFRLLTVERCQTKQYTSGSQANSNLADRLAGALWSIKGTVYESIRSYPEARRTHTNFNDHVAKAVARCI